MKFDGHGLLLVGQRTPPPSASTVESSNVQVVGLPDFLKKLVLSRLEAPSEEIPVEARILADIVRKIQENLTPMSTDEDFKEAAFEILKKVVNKDAFRTFLEKEQELHGKTCPSKDCILDRILLSIVAALDEHSQRTAGAPVAVENGVERTFGYRPVDGGDELGAIHLQVFQQLREAAGNGLMYCHG
jgi:hypothetical protein